MAVIRRGKEYENYFDPKAYLTEYHSTVEGSEHEAGFAKFVLDSLHEIFKDGSIRGDRLLDFGTGPTIHTLISATQWFKEITLSEYAAPLRNELVKWRSGDKDAHDWRPFFKYVMDLEGSGQSVEDRMDTLRKCIVDIIPCDVNNVNPLDPHSCPPFDAIISSLTLEAANYDKEAYNTSVFNLSKLLKNGGVICIIGVINESFYMVGKEKFFCLELSKNDIELALTKAGFVNVVWKIHELVAADVVSDYSASFVLTAVKK